MSTDISASRQPLPWLRLYCEIVDDPKLRLLAFEDRWHFVALLALKRGGILDGPVDDELRRRMVAVKLGLQGRELEAVAKRLAEVGLIDAESFQPLAWERRQAPSDSSRDRTKNWRQRRARHSDGDVTVQREIKKKTENKKEEEQEQGQTRLRSSRLPHDWQPSAADVSWAWAERPDLAIRLEVEKFRDYWHAKAGKDALKLDWSRTWRNWVRSARSGSPISPQRRVRPWLNNQLA
ncbi:hypothetical protein L3D22_04930 [Lysobacter soli]|uniref:hypothetical protein n=1 Tax=Lysobacter soli TaxID=453783 RepID=UPI00209CF7B0|nr:hypothetical protein [Lysobacter soli]UTA55181.1 hypothetical protein L3D22_04930 [Lysobacter soli]